MKQTIKIRTSPSLALIKYWGKENVTENLPATSSLAITLKELYTETCVTVVEGEDSVVISGKDASVERFAPFFEKVRKQFSVNYRFRVESTSNFPTAAGLASSSSGFGALAFGCAKLIDEDADISVISQLARLGSASAARATFGGFTILEKGAIQARQLFGDDHWPELRTIIAVVNGSPKKISSRTAMEMARKTSPYYPVWIKESEAIFKNSVEACRKKDLDGLGQLIRQSYLMMFSTMFTSSPPLIYWEAESLSLIKECETLRNLGLRAFETMDAGPQIKIICQEQEVEAILGQLRPKFPHISFLISQVGTGPVIL
jgi:diphosphomevalonate decarboxylase